jgi:hypothetical protein
MDIVLLANLIFSIAIVILGIRRYQQTEIKAFLFVALGFLMYGISHLAGLTGFGDLKTVLVIIRSLGYIFVLIGLLI